MIRTAEHVSNGHPDKFCDQVADHILDSVLKLTKDPNEKKSVRTAIECLAKDNLLIVSGEIKISDAVRAQISIEELAREVWRKVGYSDHGVLTVIDYVKPQSLDIRAGSSLHNGNSFTGTDNFGAGDQGIMIGYATDETEDMLPLEYVVARDLCKKVKELRQQGKLLYLKSDCKTQVTLDLMNNKVTSIIIAVQHSEEVGTDQIKQDMIQYALLPILDKYQLNTSAAIQDIAKVNGTGTFVIGGTIGDAGVVGRKIVIDAYGPRIPVGGGAYSGKDFTKVDRSAAYMARHIAKHIVAHKIQGAKACTVNLAYGIGQKQSEMVTAVTDTGQDLSKYVLEKFKDLSPEFIIDFLSLSNPQSLLDESGWNYFKTASFGHYGKPYLPWEKVN